MSTAQSNHFQKRFRRRDFDDLHREVCTDSTRDVRYQGGMTNARKTEYICKVLDYPEDAFDLDLPFPVEDWLSQDDQGLINCGLYLSDLRVQFYEAIMELTNDHPDEIWEKHGQAEFWCEAFNAMTHRRLFGNILLDDRRLN